MLKEMIFGSLTRIVCEKTLHVYAFGKFLVGNSLLIFHSLPVEKP